MSIETSAGRITVGEPVLLTGKLICSSSAQQSGQSVDVYQRTAGASGAHSFTLIASPVTAVDGSYQLPPRAVDSNTIFQVRAGAHRARTVVKVAPIVTFSAPASVTAASTVSGRPYPRTNRVTFTGTVSPVKDGARVVLQVASASDEQWRSDAFGHVGADGRYSLVHSFRAAGLVTARAIVYAGRGNVAAISHPVTYQVLARQNPQLTIESSAASTPYGQSVTISGVAAGGSQPVKLMARTHEGGSVVVANATTAAGGDYSFTQEPTQNTAYQVIDATTSSIVVSQDVTPVLAPDVSQNAVSLGKQLTFSGTVSPAHDGETVYLERAYASGLGYHVVGTGTVGEESRYTITDTLDGAGVNVLRIKLPGDGVLQAGMSKTFTVTSL